eukprot:10240954-Ditylum_brightwellii.AAC.1
MSKRPSDVQQVPNLHPSSRVESGTDAGVEAGTGLQREEEITIADEEENPNITSETTLGLQDLREHEDSSPHKPSSRTSKEDNDPGSESEAATTPPGTPRLVMQ